MVTENVLLLCLLKKPLPEPPELPLYATVADILSPE
jgi:hypothetical protein